MNFRPLSLAPLRSLLSMRRLALGVAVGVPSGLAACLFYLAVEWGGSFLLRGLAGLDLPAPGGERLFHTALGSWRPWLVPLFTAAAGLLTGFLVERFIPETIGGGTDGTDAMIKAFHRQDGVIRPRAFLIRGLTSILTLATGGSAGREGPISQVGAGIGSWLAQRLGLSARERRMLLLAGAAGGLGAIFRAPLGGAITAIEVVYREDFESEAILPAIFSSVTASSIFTFFFGNDPILDLPAFVFRDVRELAFYGLLAVVCSAGGWLYVRAFYGIKYSVFFRVKAARGLMWTAGLGGLCTGLLGLALPQVLSGGYGWLELAVAGQISALMMAVIVVAKTLATSLTIGSGMSGGMFAPALFVGGMCGGLAGKIGHELAPDIVTQPGGYVLVGMAAFFAGVGKAPIGPLIMVCELTRGYGLLAPLMLASALCITLCRRVSLYENQVDTKFDSPTHAEDATINVLEDLRVADHFEPGPVVTLPRDTALGELKDIFARTTERFFPVVDGQGRMTGILSVHGARQVLFEEGLYALLLAQDLAGKPASLTPDDDLYTALLRFVDTGYGQIPVVSAENPRKILGVIERDNVFKAYARMVRQGA
jgi:CIC family chloride channel protein